MRLFLCLVIVCAGCFVGQFLSSRLYKRKETLSSFIKELETAQSKISYSAATVYELFDMVQFNSSEEFYPQWEDMLRQYERILSKKDTELLCEFARGLGVSDAEGQLRHIKLYISLLSEQEKQAQEEISQKSKLCRILGFSAGTALALLLL